MGGQHKHNIRAAVAATEKIGTDYSVWLESVLKDFMSLLPQLDIVITIPPIPLSLHGGLTYYQRYRASEANMW